MFWGEGVGWERGNKKLKLSMLPGGSISDEKQEVAWGERRSASARPSWRHCSPRRPPECQPKTAAKPKDRQEKSWLSSECGHGRVAKSCRQSAATKLVLLIEPKSGAWCVLLPGLLAGPMKISRATVNPSVPHLAHGHMKE